MTIVKICGIRTLEEGRAALRSGADWLGFVFWEPSKRCVSPEQAAQIIHMLRAEQSVPSLGSGAPQPDPLPVRGEGVVTRGRGDAGTRRRGAGAFASQGEGNVPNEGRGWAAVGVFVDPTPEEVAAIAAQCELDYLQLSGDESVDCVRRMPLPAVKAIRVERGREQEAAWIVRENRLGAHLYLLDTHRDGMYGGTGAQFDWGALRAVGPSCIVAGGLRPENVITALDMLAPRGVDVSGGVEFPGGGKDPRLVQAFVEAVRSHDLAGAR